MSTSDEFVRGARAQLERAVSGADPFRRDGLAYPENPRRSAVLVLFGLRDDRVDLVRGEEQASDLDLVLEVRADTLRNHPGEVSFPGGATDPDDADAVATALREAWEETGLDPANVDVIGSLDDIPMRPNNFVVTPVVGWRTVPQELLPLDPRETAQVLRVPVAELIDPERRFTLVFRHDQGVFRSPAFDLGGATLWGFTAMLTDYLLTAAGWAVPWDATVEREMFSRP